MTSAVVTGGAGHLGRGMAEKLAAAGFAVVIASRNIADCELAAADVRRLGGECHAAQCDVTDQDSVVALFDRAEAISPVTVLVCNAGGSTTSGSFLETAVEEADNTIRLNLLGSYICAQEAARRMATRSYGAIVLVASIHGVVGSDPRMYSDIDGFTPSGPAYHAAKGGVVQLTRSLATSLGGSGIRVNCVSPGFVPGPDVPTTLIERYADRTPLGRVGTASDVANAIAFLAGEEAAWITGQNLVVDGGWTSW